MIRNSSLPTAVLLSLLLPVILTAETLQEKAKTVLEIPLTSLENRWMKSSGLSGYEVAQAGIAVPEGFDPEKEYPVLVTCVTGDDYLSNIEEMDKYWPQAVEAGWVVVTGWAEPRPDMDTKAFRRAVTVAAMRKLAELAPGSTSWPVAVGGFSGGAKNSAIIAAYLTREGYRIIGMFMGGCNRDMASQALRQIVKDKAAFKAIPVFFSTGEEDRMATIYEAEDAAQSMRDRGFRHIRLETYPGGHALFRKHVVEALEWFQEMNRP